jgi:hypothetical protein
MKTDPMPCRPGTNKAATGDHDRANSGMRRRLRIRNDTVIARLTFAFQRFNQAA